MRLEIDQVCSNVDGCHGTFGAAGLVFAFGNEFGPLIDAASTQMPNLLRVRPFFPEESYVYRKVACEGGIVKGCMPLGSRFDPRVARIFHDWIEAGAPTN